MSRANKKREDDVPAAQILRFFGNGPVERVKHGLSDFGKGPKLKAPVPCLVSRKNGVIGNAAMVTVAVVLVNDAPIAVKQSVTIAEDTTTGISLGATDIDGDPLTYTVVAGPAHGVLTGAAPELIYIPAADYSGPDSFLFKANDGQIDSNVAMVTITVTPQITLAGALDLKRSWTTG